MNVAPIRSQRTRRAFTPPDANYSQKSACAAVFFERALEIAPGHAFARQWMGILLSSTKRIERGVAELEHALSLAACRTQTFWDA